MIGEIRDQETATQAMHAALTGHLVFSTLHTNDALGSVTRLVDMGLEPAPLADALLLLQAQRLVRKLCPLCKQPEHVPTDSELYAHVMKYWPEGTSRLARDSKQVFHAFKERPVTYKKAGCRHCNMTGYAGRRAIMELCVVGTELRELVAAQAPYKKLMDVARKQGMRSLFESALNHYLTGETSFGEISSLRSAHTDLNAYDA
jgi:type II secretory ATPase GspE/PulE/Tfp pilus assembly ATPase PilB-like protein